MGIQLIGASLTDQGRKGGPGALPHGEALPVWEPALLPGLHAAGPCHGTELGRGSRTTRQTGNCIFWEGSQSLCPQASGH